MRPTDLDLQNYNRDQLIELVLSFSTGCTLLSKDDRDDQPFNMWIVEDEIKRAYNYSWFDRQLDLSADNQTILLFIRVITDWRTSLQNKGFWDEKLGLDVLFHKHFASNSQYYYELTIHFHFSRHSNC